MTSLTLTDSGGRPVAVGAVGKGDESSLIAPVSVPLPPGRYTVHWKTAGKDGHPSSGTVTFSVAAPVADTVPTIPPTAPRVSGPATIPQSDAEPGPSVLATVVRAIWLLSLLSMIGGIAFVTLTLDRAVLSDGMAASIRGRVARGTIIAAIVLAVATLARLFLQRRLMLDANPDAATNALVLHTSWGHAFLVQIVGACLVLLPLLANGRRSADGPAWSIASLGAIIAGAAPALSGHAAAAQASPVVAIATDALHVLGASAWLGSLVFLVLVGIPSIASGDGDRAADLRSLVNAFSPVALTFAAVVVLTGVTNSALRLGAFAAFSSPYGRVLVTKLAVFAVLVLVAAYNWRVAKPALANPNGGTRLRRGATLEVALALAIVIVTAILIGSPLP